jgi:NAD(P)-dependent dehydrogenase (short-subunit alcohol dehydrogenase family)
MAKTVLITGTSSGIGMAAARAFAAAGWNVAATMRTPQPDLYKGKPTIRVYQLDVTSASSIAAAFDSVAEEFGAIDVVVNNAGFALDGVFEGLSDQQIRKQFETNVFGLMQVTREAIKIMRPQKNGTIIQVTSMGGRVTFPLYSVYHASKWAVEGFTEALQYELSPFNIRVKIIEPGVTRTEFYGSNHMFVKPDSSLGYDAITEKCERTSQAAGAKGQAPAEVARAIVAAAIDPGNKLRYTVGAPAPLLLTLRKIIPDRTFFWLIRRSYKL